MAKRKSPATITTTDDEDHTIWASVWIPLAQADALLAIASEVEGNACYYERVYALVAAARPQVEAALKLVEEYYEGGDGELRPKGRRS